VRHPDAKPVRRNFRRKGDNLEKLSFLFVLDTSGSMYGDKIMALNTAVSAMLAGFNDLALQEPPEVAIITFGGSPALHPFTPYDKISALMFEAGGDTRLTEALAIAKELATAKTITLLVTDGLPNDGGYARFGLPGIVFAMGIGFDADVELLERFAGDPGRVVSLADAGLLPGYWFANFDKGKGHK